MAATTIKRTPPWGRIIEALAWASLVAAFIIGQLAAQPDYEALLQEKMSDLKLVRKNNNTGLPTVFEVEGDADSGKVVVIAEGVGYGGPLIVGVKSRRTEDGGKLSEIVLLSHKETPAFMQKLQQRSFLKKFAGKSVTDNFIIGDDIDAVSGATASSQGFTAAVREAVHEGAENHLKLQRTWTEPGWNFGSNELILIILFVLAYVGVYRKDKWGKYIRRAVMVGTLLFVGFYANASVSLGNLASIAMGYIPSLKQQPLWWIMMIGTIGSVVVVGRNIYCHQICPFKVVQDLLQKVSGTKLRIRPEIQRKSRLLIYSLSWAALMLIFLSVHPALGSYEPFAMMFSLDGQGIQWYILPAALIGAFFVPSFWCRLFCPVGLFLNQIVRARRAIRNRFFGTDAGRPTTRS
jgi:Na+-translocating ferredoxin:NAD+ oxidoreductase RnfG subunit